VTAGPGRFLVALLAVLAVAAVAVVLVVRPGPFAPTPVPTPIDLAGLASYPPVASMPPEETVTLTGAGDIASCERTDDEATAALLEDLPGWVFTAGDNAYESGTTEEFEQCYDPSWGASRERTFPAIGNHDAVTAGRQGYFDYFGPRAGDRRAGWYATTLGAWRLIVLDSTCVDAGGCGPDTDQGRWLAAELDSHRSDCTLAIWHHPRFSTGHHGPTLAVKPFWDALFAAGADLVVNGHDHDYERFAPVDPSGKPDAERGIRQIVAGAGGAALRPFEEENPNSEVRDASAHGVLRLGLRPGGYDWEFIPVAGGSFTDQGSGTCH
jgi:acid phosphatase type 7